jgi:hypothetical protein
MRGLGTLLSCNAFCGSDEVVAEVLMAIEAK